MTTSKARRGEKTALKILKITALAICVIVLLFASLFAAFYFTNGFGGNYATFLTNVNGHLTLSSGAMDIPRESPIQVMSFSDYTIAVAAAQPEEDFEIYCGEEKIMYSDLAGEDMTAGFTFTPAGDAVIIDYGTLEEILSTALDDEVTVSSEPTGKLFTLVIVSGDSILNLDFELSSQYIGVTGITITPDNIDF